MTALNSSTNLSEHLFLLTSLVYSTHWVFKYTHVFISFKTNLLYEYSYCIFYIHTLCLVSRCYIYRDGSRKVFLSQTLLFRRIFNRLFICYPSKTVYDKKKPIKSMLLLTNQSFIFILLTPAYLIILFLAAKHISK